MILTEQQFRAQRGKKTDNYQGFTVTVEIEEDRKYVLVEFDNLLRWRSKEEYAAYLRWAADEIEKLPI